MIMLLPDNMHPEFSIYYNGALVLKSLQQKRSQNLLEIYQDVKETYGMSFPILVLSLDWLYLVDIAKSNEKGEIQLCT
jgi:hypothetical protein